MDLLVILTRAYEVLSLPIVPVFLIVGIILTVKTRFLQLRAFPTFIRLLTKGARKADKNLKTISPMHAFFTSMATTIGMGNIVGPSIAIMLGGPGALFWMISFSFFASIIKFTEVSFGVYTRERTEQGDIIGGPTQYLKLISPWLAGWYGVVIIIVLAIWSGVQTNTMANIFAKEGIPTWQTGLALAIFVYFVLRGGAQRVGALASKLVPLMAILYLVFAAFILLQDISALKHAIVLVFQRAFRPAAAAGGFLGASMFSAMSAGIFKSVYSSEAGIGKAAIPHAMADVKKPTDQGILAIYGVAIDATIALVSGLLILVTGVWLTTKGTIDSTLIYDVFKDNSPAIGRYVLMISAGLFALTTVMGNSFDGSQSFASMTRHRFVWIYKLFTICIIFLSSLASVPVVWRVVDILVILIALPNVIGITILAFKKPDVLKV